MKLAIWLARRVGIIVLQLLVISFLAFVLLYLMPGSPERVLLGTNPVTPETLAAIREKYNLDDPFLVQYVNWLFDAVRLDFGTSIQTGERVATLLADRAASTAVLAVYATILLLISAVPLGLIAGVKAGTGIDRGISAVTTMAVSAPVFATGIVLLYVFAVALRWFPVFGSGDGGLDTIWHLTLPAITLALAVIALVARQTRAMAATVARSDFVLFGRARGVKPWTLWTRYLLRNSSLPLATSLGLVLAFFLTGAVVVERTFSIPGVGALLLNAVATKDVPVVQGATVLAGLFILLANFAADVSYLAIDPRVRKRTLA